MKRIYRVMVIAVFLFPISPLLRATSDWLIISDLPTAAGGRVIELDLSTPEPTEWLTIFVRPQGRADYTGLEAKAVGANRFRALIPADLVLAGEMKLYMAGKQADRFRFYPDTAPQATLSLTVRPGIDGGEAKPATKESKASPYSMSVDLNGSADSQLDQKNDTGGNAFSHQHQVGLSVSSRTKGMELKLHTRLAYTDQAMEGRDAVDLSDLGATVSAGRHSLDAGDLNFSETEFTLSAMGRRGFLYQFQGNKLQIKAFAMNSQQLQGFRGFGIPKAGLALYGGGLGYRSSNWGLNVLALSGKDDPSQGSGIAFSPLYQAREGSLFSVFGDLRLFHQKLILSAEGAFSRVDSDLSDAKEAENGLAWKGELSGQFGILTLRSFYRKIDDRFDSIGQAFFTNDRQQLGLESSVVLGGGMTLGAGFQDESSGTDAVPLDPNLPVQEAILSRNRQARASLGLMLGQRLNLSLTATKSWQEARQNNLILPEGALDRLGLNLNLNWMISEGASVFLNGGLDQLTCDAAPEREAKSLSLMAGANFGSGQGLSLNPSLNFNRQENPLTQTHTDILGASLNGRLGLIAEILSLDFMGSYTKMTSASLDSNNLMVDGGLLLESGRLLSFARFGVSVRGAYTLSEAYGSTQNDYRIYMRAHYSVQ